MDSEGSPQSDALLGSSEGVAAESCSGGAGPSLTAVKYEGVDDDDDDDVPSGNDTLENCMTMLDLALEKLDRATQDLYSPRTVDADDRDEGGLRVEANGERFEVGGSVLSESCAQVINGREDVARDLLSASDEAVIMMMMSDGFPM